MILMNCHSEPERSVGEETRCFNCRIRFNKNEILPRFAPQNDINHHNYNAWIVLCFILDMARNAKAMNTALNSHIAL
jgi:hypothetical protein